MKKGIYDNFETWAKDQANQGNGYEQEFMFVHVVVFLWPFVCSSTLAKTYDLKYGLHTFFKGKSASSFREIVTTLGVEDTYPYNATWDNDEDENKVLLVWPGGRNSKEDK